MNDFRLAERTRPEIRTQLRALGLMAPAKTRPAPESSRVSEEEGRDEEDEVADDDGDESRNDDGPRGTVRATDEDMAMGFDTMFLTALCAQVARLSNEGKVIRNIYIYIYIK